MIDISIKDEIAQRTLSDLGLGTPPVASPQSLLGASERGRARICNQWLKRTPLEKRFSHPMVYYTSLSPLDKL